MISRFYADIASTRDVICVLRMDDPDDGAPTPPIYEGVECQSLGTAFTWNAPSDTSKPTWPVGATAIVWVETATLDEIKSKKNAEINAARLSANMTSFPYGGKSIACDALSRSDIDGTNGYVTLNGALPPNWGGAWKAIDNTYVTITTVDDWKAFYAAMISQGQTNFSHAQDLKSQLAGATTPEQVAAIVW